MLTTNDIISQPFKLFRGTRLLYTCLLFVIAMEPLAIDPSIHGIKTGDMVHNTAMYADDTIVFLSHLVESIPSLLELFNQFGNISGFKVNKEKSSIVFKCN